MKLPINFEQFSKDPVKGLLFIVIVAIGYLYIDIKMNYSDQILKSDTQNIQLNEKVEKLTEHVRRSDSTLGYMISKVEMLEIIRNEKK
jgi:hypothetical protein